MAIEVNPDMFGMLQAVVRDNSDPSQLGRIKVDIPALGIAVSNWALPCVQPNQVGAEGQGLPAVGSHVWIAFENGDEAVRYGWAVSIPAQMKLQPHFEHRFVAMIRWTVQY